MVDQDVLEPERLICFYPYAVLKLDSCRDSGKPR